MVITNVFDILKSWGLYPYCGHGRLHPITRAGTATRGPDGKHHVLTNRDWACPLCRVWPDLSRVTDAEVASWLGTDPNRWKWWSEAQQRRP